MWGKNRLFLCRLSNLTFCVCSPNHYDLKVQLHELATYNLHELAVRFSRHKPDSKPTPNTDMASCNFIKFQYLEHEIFCFANIKYFTCALRKH